MNLDEVVKALVRVSWIIDDDTYTKLIIRPDGSAVIQYGYYETTLAEFRSMESLEKFLLKPYHTTKLPNSKPPTG